MVRWLYTELSRRCLIGYDRTDKEHQLQGESASATKLFKKILTKANVEHKEKFMKPEGVETIGV